MMLGGGSVSPLHIPLTIDEPILRRRARYTLYNLHAKLSHGIRDVRNGIRRIGDDGSRWIGNGIGNDGFGRDGNGNGVSLWNDDAESIWVFWDGESSSPSPLPLSLVGRIERVADR
jgi:hypothetical protein